MIPYLDTVDPAAEAAGSVNTLIIENGRIHGASTDGYGLEHALLENFSRPLAGAGVTFIGAGGAAPCDRLPSRRPRREVDPHREPHRCEGG